MRVKVRFNAEACQAPVIIDLRFLPRIGERLQIGFRRVIEVLDVRRIDDDSRYGGIIRGQFIREERNAPPPPPPPRMPMPMPPISIPIAAPVEPRPASAALYANLNFDELAATVQTRTTIADPTL